MCPSGPSRSSVEALEALKQAVLAPLRFAGRDGFARARRVAHLVQTVQQSLAKLAASCPADGRLRAMQQRLTQLPPGPLPDPAEQPAFYAALSELTAELSAWQPALDSPPPPSLPAATPHRPERPDRPSTRFRTATARPLDPAGPTTTLPGVGPKLAVQLAERNVETIEQLLRFLPRRYRSLENIAAISELRADVLATVEGIVQAVSTRYVRGRQQLEVVLSDGSASVSLFWFRAPGRQFAEQFVRGARFAASGTARRHRARFQLVHPEIRRLEDLGTLPIAAEALADDEAGDGFQDDGIVPLYLDVPGVHPQRLRRLIATALPAATRLPETLPESVRLRRGLLGLAEALQAVHAPAADADIAALEARRDPGHRRLIYEELFFLQLGLLSRRQAAKDGERAARYGLPQSFAALALGLLPFDLTPGQAAALVDIERDLRSGQPMQRLLQGDVGSGKTAVAWVAAVAMAKLGQQTALMVPTELLAEQHGRTGRALLRAYGIELGVLTSSTPQKERRALLAGLASGALPVVVGTQALIGQAISFARLGLAIVDEQHRFGVMQRARLSELGRAGQGLVPHMLVMTATPIPRTLALTVYGDLAVSLLRGLPPGRQPIETLLFAERERSKAYARVRQEVALGRQVYVVFPLVAASDKEGMGDIRAATESAQELADGWLHGLRLALLHGQVANADKDAIMRRFAAHEIDVLIATTVVEVGIDVPNASVMVIEHAERFGLSQLHQLRGRVGRGTAKSTCLLLTRGRSAQSALSRLSAMCESNDGFFIAEQDLLLRGPGDFVGTRQSGLPLLSLADLTRDAHLLESARADAAELLRQDAGLSAPAHRATARALAAWRLREQPLIEVG